MLRRSETSPTCQNVYAGRTCSLINGHDGVFHEDCDGWRWSIGLGSYSVEDDDVEG